jgi:hypothetical protein
MMPRVSESAERSMLRQSPHGADGAIEVSTFGVIPPRSFLPETRGRRSLAIEWDEHHGVMLAVQSGRYPVARRFIRSGNLIRCH